MGRRALRLELNDRWRKTPMSRPIRDPSLFQAASFILEVSANRSLTDIQTQFPNLLKLGPNTKMNEIVHANLPGVPLVHLPTPPNADPGDFRPRLFLSRQAFAALARIQLAPVRSGFTLPATGRSLSSNYGRC